MYIRLFLIFMLFSTDIFGARVQELANVMGVRDNQLIGYGLVVGLNGTGDGSSSQFTKRAVASMLKSVNVKINPRDIKSKNVAAVVVTGKLPPFSRHGDRLDIEVSSIGDAKSIRGGTLLLTPLKSVDGQIYAVGQGKIDTGFSSARARVKPIASAKIFGGAIVERELGFDLYNKSSINISLKKADFNSALKIQNSIRNAFGRNVAVALDPRTIKLNRPQNLSMVEFLARVNNLQVQDVQSGKVVIDESSGTVIAGIDVLIEPVVVTHGELTIKIQPTAKNLGHKTQVNVQDNLIRMEAGEITVANVARVLKRLGSTPADIIAILKTIKRSGAILADLEVI